MLLRTDQVLDVAAATAGLSLQWGVDAEHETQYVAGAAFLILERGAAVNNARRAPLLPHSRSLMSGAGVAGAVRSLNEWRRVARELFSSLMILSAVAEPRRVARR